MNRRAPWWWPFAKLGLHLSMWIWPNLYAMRKLESMRAREIRR